MALSQKFRDLLRELAPLALALGLPIFAAPVFSAAQPAVEAETAQLTVHQVAQRVDAYYNALHSLRADFTESYQGMGMQREERGTLLLRKPGKMRWSYAQPAGKLFILNNKSGWFYTPGDAHAEHLPASQIGDMRSPLRFLLGHTQLEKEFVNLSLASSANGLELSGVPKNMQGRVTGITLGVTTEGTIRSITVTEPDGARTSFTFTNLQPNTPAPDSNFVFQAPVGVPVVDVPAPPV